MGNSGQNKRILITAFDFPPRTGGVSTYSYELAESLSRQGYDVLVVTKKAKQDFKNHSFKIKPLHLPTSGLLSFPLFAIRLVPILKNFQPDHILCTLWMPGAAAVYTALQFLRAQIPYSIIVHGMEIVESKETFKKRLRSSLSFLKEKTFSQAQRCIAISQFTRDKLISMKLSSPDKITVIHNGVNPKKFHLISEKKDKAGTNLLTVARLVPHKGIDQVLYALPRVIREIPDLKYSIAGAGPDRERLESIVTELVLTKHVHFLGKVSNSDLSTLYAESDLFILLSREEKHNVEGFGLVFLEAAACKTPSLGGRSGGIPDAIIDEKTGWLVSPEDQQEIAPKLIHILKNPQQLKETGEFAYKHTLENRTWDHVVKNITEQCEISL